MFGIFLCLEVLTKGGVPFYQNPLAAEMLRYSNRLIEVRELHFIGNNEGGHIAVVQRF
jgi:hypothetical protein